MKKISNNIFTGIFLGILSPALAFTAFSLVAFPELPVKEVIDGYIRRNVFTHVISLSVIINLPIFFILLHHNIENTARGIIGATLLYAFLIVLLKFT